MRPDFTRLHLHRRCTLQPWCHIMGSSYDQDSNMKYLTKWVGFPEEENWTEEPLEHFLGSGEGMIRAFHRKHPNVAKDPRVRL